jgi:hypothetical protein
MIRTIKKMIVTMSKKVQGKLDLLSTRRLVEGIVECE